MITLESVKADIQADRDNVRTKVIEALKDGPATTSALREMFENYQKQRHRRTAFWNRLRELEFAGLVVRDASIQLNAWEFPETVWRLP